ncbi:hypothetical protein GF373_17580 [bacterium]|nr:hypothetical protein [bacterium]
MSKQLSKEQIDDLLKRLQNESVEEVRKDFQTRVQRLEQHEKDANDVVLREYDRIEKLKRYLAEHQRELLEHVGRVREGQDKLVNEIRGDINSVVHRIERARKLITREDSLATVVRRRQLEYNALLDILDMMIIEEDKC